MQMAAWERKQKVQVLSELLKNFKNLETQHELSHSPSVSAKLQKCRHELRLLLSLSMKSPYRVLK